MAPTYDASRGGTARAAGFAGQLAPLLDPAERVLDIGVGTGIVAAELTALGHRVHGVDLSPGMLAQARDRLGPRVAVGDAGRLPVRTGAVAQAVSTWLLHAGPDPRAVFAEVARVLRPGGRYLVIPARGMRPADDIGRIVGELEDRLDPDGTRQDSPSCSPRWPRRTGCATRGRGASGPPSSTCRRRAWPARSPTGGCSPARGRCGPRTWTWWRRPAPGSGRCRSRGGRGCGRWPTS
ncbi:class I SAM-dependent methyltransferase [Streptomyces sp. SBR177]